MMFNKLSSYNPEGSARRGKGEEEGRERGRQRWGNQGNRGQTMQYKTGYVECMGRKQKRIGSYNTLFSILHPTTPPLQPTCTACGVIII